MIGSIPSLVDLKRHLNWQNCEVWLVGKGPSLRFHQQFIPTDAKVIAINHACMVVKCDLVIFTDVEALDDCNQVLFGDSEIKVLLPNVPHIGNMPRNIDINALRNHISIIDNLIERQRLYVYQSSNTKLKRELGQIIELKNFSVEPAYQIACLLGATQIKTIGIDGGGSYSNILDSTTQKRRLSNGRSSFDSQFKQLERLKSRHGVPMTNGFEKQKIFVGVAERELIAFKVLEYSIQKFASIPVEVIPLPTVRLKPKNRSNKAKTPFSFSRFLIPSLMSYTGRAVYFDSDMLVLDDVAELFSFQMPEQAVAVTRQDAIPEKWKNNPHFSKGRQFSVMIIECSRVNWDIKNIIGDLDENRYTYQQLMSSLANEKEDSICDSLPATWNHLEYYESGSTQLLHFTVVPTQPWKDPTHPYFQLWIDYFVEALAAGFIDRELVERSVRRGHIHRKLLEIANEFLEHIPKQPTRPQENLELVGKRYTDYWFRLTAIQRNLRWRIGRKLGHQK